MALLLCQFPVVLAQPNKDRSPSQPLASPSPQVQATIEQAKNLLSAGHAEGAIALLEKAVDKAKTGKKELDEGIAAMSLADIEAAAGHNDKAHATLYQALESFRHASDHVDAAIAFVEAGTSTERGAVAEDLKRDMAVGTPAATLSLPPGATSAPAEGLRQKVKGANLMDAAAEYRSAAEEFEAAGYYEEAAYARVKTGEMWQRRGRLLPAIDAYNRAVELSNRSGGKFRQNGYGHKEAFGLAESGLASVYISIGNYRFADYLLSPNLLLESVEDAPLTYAAMENQYAAIDLRFGQFEDALGRTEMGLKGARLVGERQLEAQLLFRRAMARIGLGREGAKEDISAAAAIADELKDEHLRGMFLLELARTTDDARKAKNILAQAIQRFSDFPDSALMIEAMESYSVQCARLEDWVEVGKWLEIAASDAEEVADDFPKLTDMRVNFYRLHQSIFNGLIDVYLQQGDLSNAYWHLEEKKARGILDASSIQGSALLSRLTGDEKQALDANREDIAKYARQELAARLTGTENTMSRVWLGIREMDLDAYLNTLYAKHKDVPQNYPTPLCDLEYLPRILTEDTALLEYAALDSGVGDRMVLLALTVEKGSLQLRQYELKTLEGKPLQVDEAQNLALGFRVAATVTAAPVTAPGSQLYQVFLAPAEEQIHGKQRWIICPDGPLWGIPFQAFIGPDHKYVLEKHEIDYEYSVSTFAALMNRKPKPHDSGPKKVLVVANPSYGTETRFSRDLEGAQARKNTRSDQAWIAALPKTAIEASKIKEAFPQAELLQEQNAQETKVREEMADADYVHFATHAIVFDDEPFLSALVLAAPEPDQAGDGLLTARSLMDMKLKAEMIVLSACNTGQGERRGSEGFVGLGWSLFVAGSPTQVVSQWEVSDASTADLMSGFYGRLKGGEGKGVALTESARDMLKNPQTRHPYHWASFFLIGDYR